jgi:hypothetical protein
MPEDLPENPVDFSCMAYNKHMTALWDGVAGPGEPDRKYFVPGAVYMPERLGNILVPPIQYSVQGPFNKPGVAIPDNLPDQSFILSLFTGE